MGIMLSVLDALNPTPVRSKSAVDISFPPIPGSKPGTRADDDDEVNAGDDDEVNANVNDPTDLDTDTAITGNTGIARITGDEFKESDTDSQSAASSTFDDQKARELTKAIIEADWADMESDVTLSDFDDDGYSSEGYNEAGYDRDGYNRDGINSDGYDSEGNDLSHW